MIERACWRRGLGAETGDAARVDLVRASMLVGALIVVLLVGPVG
ncbi:hypothetical protein ACFSEO_03615 [Agromyces cerinus subsp. nitratus]